MSHSGGVTALVRYRNKCSTFALLENPPNLPWLIGFSIPQSVMANFAQMTVNSRQHRHRLLAQLLCEQPTNDYSQLSYSQLG